MHIWGYCRASTEEQDAHRAKNTLKEFILKNGLKVTKFYVENISGNKLDRPKLNELLDDAERGDILLVESIDRLTRLNKADWQSLLSIIKDKGIAVVSLDLPTSHMIFNKSTSSDFMDGVLCAVNGMLLEILAVTSYKEYKERERKQREGIERARSQGKYRGRPADIEKYKSIVKLREAGLTWSEIIENANVSKGTVRKALQWGGLI